jgi:hypothetical protein
VGTVEGGGICPPLVQGKHLFHFLVHGHCQYPLLDLFTSVLLGGAKRGWWVKRREGIEGGGERGTGVGKGLTGMKTAAGKGISNGISVSVKSE